MTFSLIVDSKYLGTGLYIPLAGPPTKDSIPILAGKRATAPKMVFYGDGDFFKTPASRTYFRRSTPVTIKLGKMSELKTHYQGSSC